MSDEAPDPVRLTLDGTQSVRTIAAARAALLDALAGHQAVEIDCGAADGVDLSLIQLLLSARLTAQQAGTRLVIAVPAGSALRAALEQGGFLSPQGISPFDPTDT